MILGIDPSLSGTAAVALTATGDIDAQRVFSSKPAGKLVAARIARYHKQACDVAAFAALVRPSLIVIEGYSYGSRAGQAVDLGEYGSLLRFNLLGLNCPIEEVAPATLKKFATGKGNSDKAVMRLEVYKRWGYEAKSDDEIDAYALARLGLVLAGHVEAANERQREACKAVLKDRVLEIAHA